MQPDKNRKNLNVPEKHLPLRTLTKEEIHKVALERVSLIAKEFSEGFEFLQKYPRSVTFFGGTRFNEESLYYKQARSLSGRIVRELGYAIFSGGGPGIMEAANRGAWENNGQSLGLTIELPEGQAINPYINDAVDFYYFFSRKVCLSYSAEAYIFFPGGFGTLDEAFEILTLVQTHKIEQVPVILVGADFWKPVEDILKKELLTRGTIDESDLALYTITDDEDKIIDIIKNTPVRNGVPFNPVISGGLKAKNHKTSEKTEPSDLSKKTCVPCEGNAQPLSHEKNEELLSEVHQWLLVNDKHIEKTLHFKDFMETLNFVDRVGIIAEAEGHHPDIHMFGYNKVRLVLSTHAINGLSENDFILASKIDDLSK